MVKRFLAGLMVALVSTGCSNDRQLRENKLFQLMSPEETNVLFNNRISDSDSVNILTYEYLYNGGGVGILDVNNDGLNDIFFTGNQVQSALYLNKGNFVFEDISASAGIANEPEWCTGVSVVDINSDGWDDIYVSVGGRGNQDKFPNKLFINQKDLTFKEAANQYGIADPGESIQAVFIDYDKDDDLDMYLLTGGGFEKSAIVARPILANGENRNTDRLYQNTYDSSVGHAVFKNVSRESGILTEGFGLGVSVTDANQDGWPDIYVSNDYLSPDNLYINNKNGTFTDKALEFFKHTSHFSMGNDCGDINNDGLADIITVDMLPDNINRRKRMFGPDDYDRFYLAVGMNYNFQYMRNMLHLNTSDGFIEIGQMAGVNKTDWSWAPLLADFDNDGYQDLFITNGFGKDITDLDFVKFRQDAVSPFDDAKKINQVFIDSLEERPAVSLPDYIFRNEHNLNFSDQSDNWGIIDPSISSGAAYTDLDNDGDLDIVVSNINQHAFIYNNTLIQRDSLQTHFLKVKLTGSKNNPGALGASVRVYTKAEFQDRHVQFVRGFQSSMKEPLHFGLGENDHADSIVVNWGNGRVSRLKNIRANEVVKFIYDDSEPNTIPSKQVSTHLTSEPLVEVIHHETPSQDFKIQPLLLHGFSNQGPGITIGDVNADGLDDMFVGGAYQSQGHLLIQGRDGKFSDRPLPTEKYEDVGCLFFDADQDSDLDLYVTSGGSERFEGNQYYQDRLYFNDGKGNFELNPEALPSMLTSTSTVVSADFDSDGDQDLFVGGRVVPGKFPQTPHSYILENRAGKFFDSTDKINQELSKLGMVTSAVWTDFNNDKLPDLVVTGEFMRINLFKNDGKALINITGQTALADSFGLWSSIHAADMDNDGDMDLIAGNIGLNTPFKVSESKPLELHYADFDMNGSVDPIFSAWENDASYPVASLDQLTKQIPFIKKHVLHYRDYASLTTEKLLSTLGNTKVETLRCNLAYSAFIENLGNEKFAITALPIGVQTAPVTGISAEDIDSDGRKDLILIGGQYDTEVVYGRYDATNGNILVNKGKNVFELLPMSNSGFVVKGEARNISILQLRNKRMVIVSQNNDGLLCFEISQPLNLTANKNKK